jgi:glycerol-3-phosphate acyltransferase PlsY
MAVLLAIVLGYLCGSVPFGLVIARARKVDLRAVGSGNIGATNAARALGRGYGLLVLLLDALKATGPVLLAERYFAADPRQPWIVVAVAAAAFVGHLWPVFARFQGGKGVATALGCFVAIAPLPALCGALTWVVLFGVTRISSVGSLGAVVLFPAWLYLFSAGPPVYALTALPAMIMWSVGTFYPWHNGKRSKHDASVLIFVQETRCNNWYH